jgi:starch synthase
VDVVLLDHPYYDRPGGPYDSGSIHGSVYGVDENAERFAFFARASLEAARALGFQPDIVHAHDWHAGLIPAYLNLVYGSDPFFAATRSVVTIHNIAYQGWYPREVAETIGFAATDAENGGPLSHHDGISFLKAGIRLADAVTTVSKTYAKQVLQAEFGMGLEDELTARQDGVHGIVNGTDKELYDSSTDPRIPVHYGISDAAAAKAVNKDLLQRRLGLDADPSAPIFAVASRLAHQKGIDLILDAAERILALGAQLVVTGSGDKNLEDRVAELAAKYPGRFGRHSFSEIFVHPLFAGADFLLMPSRFEPCGISQLIAMLYGTLPIVTMTGGLLDTVTDLRQNPKTGNGLYVRNFSVHALVEAIADAIAGYRSPEAMGAAVRRAMENDSSWDSSVEQYEKLFRELVARPRSRDAKAPPASGDKDSSTSSDNEARRDGSTAR